MHHPVVHLGVWLAVSILLIGAGTLAIGLRADLPSALKSTGFQAECSLMLSLALASTLAAFSLSVPNRQALWTSLLPAMAFALWAARILFMATSENRLELGNGLPCLRDISMLSLVPGGLLFFMLSRGAPLRIGTVGFYAASGVAALSCLATEFLCRNENPLHTLVWHFLPVLAASVAGLGIGRLCFGRFAFPERRYRVHGKR